MSTLIAALALGIPTVLLALHLLRAAVVRVRGSHPEVPLVDLDRVGLGFAVSVLALALGEVITRRDGMGNAGLASTVTFCAAIAWGFWAQGARSRWSPAVILLVSAVAACLVGAVAPV